MNAPSSTGNRLIGPFMVIVRGKTTGLAGCLDVKTCACANSCLRADEQLQHRARHQEEGACRSQILKT